MTRKTYPQTADSGHQWLGRLPAHWSLAPLGTHFDERSETVSDEEYPPLSVTKDGVVPQMANVAKTDNNNSRKRVRVGDFAINSRSDRKGSAGLSSLDGSTSVVYTILAPRSSIDGRFAHHLLRSSAFQEEFYRWGNGIVADLWSTRYSSMKRISLPVPPLDEQRAIAHYLDRETARIDSLIEEQQRLIELARERRNAVITESVSHGAPVEFRRVIAGLRQGWSPNCEARPADGVSEWGVLKVGCANTGAFDPTENKRLPAEETPRPELAVRRGELVMSRSNTKDLVGAAAVVDGDYPRLLLSDLTYGVSLTPSAEPAFVAYSLATPFARSQIAVASKGMSHTMQKISQRDIRELTIQLPDVDEQRRVVAYLDQQTMATDTLIAETERFIELARERRAALITAAVTGQIDVRDAA